ncbi:MAG: molybdopterin-dependent oxidoreductase, partial [Planctomycetales bacterium]|nr:molybdopterin-dependent oxidoreductase [Planctomycetales bacterium]
MDDAKLTDETNEPERYELHEPIRYRIEPSRREFGQLLGTGLLITAVTTPAKAQRRRGGGTAAVKLAQRFHLSDSGRVTVLSSKVEVGQGARTQIAQAVAEELRVTVHDIDVILADTQRCPDDGGTAGSRTTPATIPQIRRDAAALRAQLVALAAEQLQVEPGQIEFQQGQFRVAGELQSLSLPDLVRQALGATSAPASVGALSPLSAWTILGKSTPAVNLAAIVDGSHRFPSDVRRPDMVYGKILRP